ncbi:hypothetical protein WG66_007410 [Moniliophthora roreri]|nr:hypothetical protein WG66_007410 [Moniliophthora roreri]
MPLVLRSFAIWAAVYDETTIWCLSITGSVDLCLSSVVGASKSELVLIRPEDDPYCFIDYPPITGKGSPGVAYDLSFATRYSHRWKGIVE